MKRGGARNGSGRPLSYGEETDVISFRVPLSLKESISKLVQSILKKHKK
jgi:hypothetical protein